jgi:hypothetical protein
MSENSDTANSQNDRRFDYRSTSQHDDFHPPLLMLLAMFLMGVIITGVNGIALWYSMQAYTSDEGFIVTILGLSRYYSPYTGMSSIVFDVILTSMGIFVLSVSIYFLIKRMTRHAK